MLCGTSYHTVVHLVTLVTERAVRNIRNGDEVTSQRASKLRNMNVSFKGRDRGGAVAGYQERAQINNSTQVAASEDDSDG
jgi:hypothetical protein